MSRIYFAFFLVWATSCGTGEEHNHKSSEDQMEKVILGLEIDGKRLMTEIQVIASFGEELLRNQDRIDLSARPLKYTLVNGISTNRPGDGSDLSTIFISQVSADPILAAKEVVILNPLDSLFKDLLFQYPLVSQVYSNSVNQVSRVYPSYDATNLLEPDLDVTAFNFFYEADESHNPERVPRWLPDPYIDPAGRGWIVSLIAPIYFNDELHSVLGADFNIDLVLGPYLDSFEGNYILVTGKGDVVAGSPQAINQLGFPPLRNHVYQEAIRSDNFRISDYNLYNSKSPEVRRMAQDLLLSTSNHFEFQEEVGITCAIAARFELVDWLLIKILN